MSKPNILFIFSDQQRYNALGCTGNSTVRTPAIDRLADDGIVFDQAFSSCPICSPYRGQLLTGRYSHANGVIDNEYELFDNQETIAHVLKDQGYKTAFIGKWHLGYPPYTTDKRYGFDDLYAHNCDHDYFKVKYWHNEEGPFDISGYAPRFETQLTLEYIKNHIDNSPDQPFCVIMSWGPPHWYPANSDRDYGLFPQEHDIYDPDSIEVPPNVPRQFIPFARKEIADYYGMVSSLDECVGQIMDSLDEAGIGENTILCYSSDHGDHLSSHGYGKPPDAGGELSDQWMHHTLQASKATPHEESIHIPFILKYPDRVEPSRRTDVLFNSVDVFPTLLGLCGIKIPDEVQGMDLSERIITSSGNEPDSVYLQILGPGWPTRKKWVGLWRGVRTDRYIYARWKDRGGRCVLYDRQKDPFELDNLIDHPEYEQVVVDLEARLKKWMAFTEDPFDTGERLPGTEMLDLNQKFTSDHWYEIAPKEYVSALKK